ncbi:MAG TPA: SIS domain-containing protein [Clostridiales bacterium]|jgi:glucosamine--fructose-6-phosphate aminotransferase (isomerizing)|nr:SIS domain-containing protein [Clostridiales bacterium]
MSKTYEEIKGQFTALAKTSEYIKNRINIIQRFLNEKETKIMAFIGSGSSYALAKSCEHIYRNLTGKPAVSLASGDLMLHPERYAQALSGGVIVAITRSGSTSEILKAIDAIKRHADVRVVAIACVEGSPIESIADFTLSLPWAFDESICQTRTVSNLFLAGALFSAGLGGRADVIRDLDKTIGLLEGFCNRIEPEFLTLAKEKWDHVVVLADGEIAGLAEEGALAFKEICQLPSNQYGLLDVRHGPMVIINNRTLVLACLTEANDYETKLISDLCAKHATVVCYSDLPVKLDSKVFAQFDMGETLDTVSRGLPLILICQLASYYKALVRGTNPDMPDGLDAWVKL